MTPDDLDARLYLIRVGPGVDGLVVIVVVIAFWGWRGDLVRFVRIDEPDDEILHACVTGEHAVRDLEHCLDRRREMCHVVLDLVESVLDAFGNLDLAFARQQFDGTHFTHVHPHGVRRSPEFGVDARERGLGFLGCFLVGCRRVGQSRRLGLRCLFVHRDSHVVNHVDDIFDLLGIDDVVGQVIIDLNIGQVSLLLASGNQVFQLLSLLAYGHRCLFFTQDENPYG